MLGRLNAVHSATTGMPMPMPQMAPPQHMYPGMAPGMAALAGGKRAAAQGGGNAKKLSRRGSQSSKQAQRRRSSKRRSIRHR